MRCNAWVKFSDKKKKARMPAKATDPGAFICDGRIIPHVSDILYANEVGYVCEQCDNHRFKTLPKTTNEVNDLLAEAIEKLR